MKKDTTTKYGKHAASKTGTQEDEVQPTKNRRGKHANGKKSDAPEVSVASESNPSDASVSRESGFEIANQSDEFDSLPLKYASDQDFATNSPLYSQGEFDLPQEQKKKLHFAIKGFIGLLGLLIVAYIGAAVYFSNFFMPRTTIASVDISSMSVEETEVALHELVSGYSLNVEGQGFSTQISADEINLTIEDEKTFDSVLADYNPWKWPVDIFSSRDFADSVAVSYDNAALSELITSAVGAFDETATPPTVAAVGFDEAANAFVVNPAAVGTALDPQSVLKVVQSSLDSLIPTAVLSTDELMQPEGEGDSELMESAIASANSQLGVDLALTMGGTTVGQVDSALLAQWMTFPGDGTALLNIESLTAWVNELAWGCTTLGSERVYTRPDGKEVFISGGSYGWEVDAASLQALVLDAIAFKRVETVAAPTLSDAAVFNGLGVQDWGARYCDVDLSEQYARMYDESGTLVWESPIVSGKPNGYYDTPTGVYYITNKGRNITLTGYENGQKTYESKVSYWMPFIGNVFGLHDASWQYAFGGTRYRDGYGSHGCVNLPVSQAASLYDIIQNGDVVISHW